jgi:hypothetical protein
LEAGLLEDGVKELNDILYAFNLQNYFPFTRNSIDYTIGNVKSTYSIGVSGTDIIAEVPILVSKVYCRSSSSTNYLTLKRVAFEDIFGFRSSESSNGIPLLYSYDRTWPNGRLVFNINPIAGSVFTLIYNKAIPEVNVNTILDIPNEYADIIKNALAVVLMTKWKSDQQAIALVDSAAKEGLSNLKERNQVDKVISYSQNGAYNQDPQSFYLNIMSPAQWM